MTTHFKNIALVGASGSLGSKVLDSLLKQGKHNITVITRTASTATFADTVKTCKVDYSDTTGLEAALVGQDVLVIMLAFAGLHDEEGIIEAAGRAGVKYVIPSEYGLPSRGPMAEEALSLSFMQGKYALHEKITSLGMKYVIVATNSWIDWSLTYNALGIDATARTATLYTDSIAFNTTTLPQIGLGIAKFLALPRSTIDKQFANGFLYLSSFKLTQPELFRAVLAATRTKESDWQIERTSFETLIEDGHKKVSEGDVIAGSIDVVHGITFKAGDYSGEVHNDMLGLKQEDLGEVVRNALSISA
ncbi:hypothetical protein LTS10_002199 [Elasticomyces elasticus]|nr:hypothetical protein LTS10_002199 [Elasticomyces elasticus]